MMPNGIPTTIAISRLSGLPPRAFQRRVEMTIATMMPAMMQSAYARMREPENHPDPGRRAGDEQREDQRGHDLLTCSIFAVSASGVRVAMSTS